MLKDITFGQFFPGESLLHKTDARFKIVILIVYLVLVLLAKSAAAFLFVALLTAALLLCSRLSWRILLKGLKPLLFILMFTALINLFATQGQTVLWQWSFLRITKEGLLNAVFMLCRLLSLFLGSSVILTYTTSPLDLTDGIERLLSPLRHLHVPVHDFAMMMTIALRFIPVLVEETDKIMSAQKARGADFESGGVLSRAKALIPILVPLFVSSFRRADELAVAMECRCYHTSGPRSRLKTMTMRARDYAMLAVMLLIIPAILFGTNHVLFSIIPTTL